MSRVRTSQILKAGIIVLGGVLAAGCATESNVYDRAVTAQSAKCKAIAKSGPQNELGPCQDRLEQFYELAAVHDAEIEESLTPPPIQMQRNLSVDANNLAAISFGSTRP
jgi:hypothetical protein